MFRLRSRGLGSSIEDLLSSASGVATKAGARASQTATQTAVQTLYDNEQTRIRAILDHTDQAVVNANDSIDWIRVGFTAACSAATVFFLTKAIRRMR